MSHCTGLDRTLPHTRCSSSSGNDSPSWFRHCLMESFEIAFYIDVFRFSTNISRHTISQLWLFFNCLQESKCHYLEWWNNCKKYKKVKQYKTKKLSLLFKDITMRSENLCHKYCLCKDDGWEDLEVMHFWQEICTQSRVGSNNCCSWKRFLHAAPWASVA